MSGAKPNTPPPPRPCAICGRTDVARNKLGQLLAHTRNEPPGKPKFDPARGWWITPPPIAVACEGATKGARP